MEAPARFELTDVVAGPADDPILRGVTVEIPGHGITALVGPSGAGKSTLLRLLNRLDEPVSGSVVLDGAPIGDLEPTELRRRVAMVFQRPPLFAGDVLANLRVADSTLTETGAGDALVGVGLSPSVLGQDAADLSGGEAQRLCLARAMLTRPSILLADEPTASLDGTAKTRIEQLALEVAARGIGIVWVTHDVAQLRRIADRAVVLIGGRVAAFGSIAELAASDRSDVREAMG